MNKVTVISIDPIGTEVFINPKVHMWINNELYLIETSDRRRFEFPSFNVLKVITEENDDKS